MNDFRFVEGKLEYLIILRPDLDAVSIANNVDVTRFRRKLHGISESTKTVPDVSVGADRSKPGLVLHRILEAIVGESILACEHPEVDDRDDDNDLNQAAEAARTWSSISLDYHCDCAP